MPDGNAATLDKIGLHTWLSAAALNVLDMPGVVGDSSNDDTAGIQFALDTCPAYGAVLFPQPPVSYKISRLYARSPNITMLGVGLPRIRQVSASSLVSAVEVVSSGITIDGLFIDGVVASGNENVEENACIHLTWSGSVVPLSNITIRNCILSGKVAGIFTDNRDATNAFALSNIKFIHNVVRGLQYGILVNAFLQSTILHDGILFDANDIEVSAIGGYGSFYNARPLMAWNANNVRVVNNKTIGGFSCIELISSPASGLAHRTGNQVVGNQGDSHLSFTQTDGGVLVGNLVDMALRNSAWPSYDASGVTSFYGYLPGIEASDNFDMSVSANTVRNPVGDCLDFGGNRSSACVGNNLSGAGSTAGSPATANGIIIRYGNNLDSIIADNTIRECAHSGITQDTGTNWAPIERLSIVANKIKNVQRHGVHIQNANDLTISNNGFKDCNLAGGTYNGIDLSATFLGNSVICKANDNTFDGCYHAIFEPYSNAGNHRLSQFRRNTVVSHTATNAFVIYGHRGENWAPILSTGYIASIVGTHIDMSHGLDLIYLEPGGSAHLAFLDNLSIGDKATIFFKNGNTTIINAVNRMNLAGNLDITPGTSSVMVFMCTQDAVNTDEAIIEISRSIR